ncbi:Acg family FMN-binding oxidoreductase [Paractinoplanes ovalisporus]|uniref:Acg family FMN-binding oxidoreductase n=1 Tax=Paractinoplanes ovalisporus TaxID=2810368 RepID=UPI0027DC467F|nr:nitroreductase family protein [Actinoplanes ovalisporus]
MTHPEHARVARPTPPPSYGDAELHEAALAAIRAPSMHNSQPWRLRLRDGAIEVLADPGRRLTVADRTGWAVLIACGAATFNARLALAVRGRPAEVRLLPAADVVARLSPGRERPATYAEEALYARIPQRHSNRSPFWPEPVPRDIRRRLARAADSEQAWLDLVVDRPALTQLAEIAVSADEVLRRDDNYQAELLAWTHTDSAADGVPVRAGGVRPEPQDLLPQRGFGGRTRAPGRDYEAEPLVGVLGMSGDRPADQVQAGQALEKVLLTATDSGLAVSLISQPIEVAAARARLRRFLNRPGWPQMVLRLGYGVPGRAGPRRRLSEVLT